MFLEQQISILEWFLKDHVTQKTAIWNYNIFQFYCIFDQTNAALMSTRDFFQKHKIIIIHYVYCTAYATLLHTAILKVQ